MKVVFDMETGDPDDFLTLLLLLGHPRVELVGVTITPGGPDQVGLVREALKWFDTDIPVGAFHQPDALERSDVKLHGEARSRVSGWHRKVYGDFPKSYEAEEGWKVLERLLGPDTTLVTGAPLKNLGKLLLELEDSALERGLYDQHSHLGRLFVQGGFAGEGVVPEENQLDKFKGKVTVPTYNLNGDPKAALRVINHAGWFSDLRFISKNVCHGVYYDQTMHDAFGAAIGEPYEVCTFDTEPEPVLSAHQRSLQLIHKGMSYYLRKKPEGKKFHDPLAAACAIDPDVGEWAEVMLYRERGQWGSYLDESSGIRIIIGYDHDRFVETLLA